MGTRMRQAPVFYTLVQVVFNSILQMADYVPKIQDRLRRDGFPDFHQAKPNAIAMTFPGAEGGAPQMTTKEGPTQWGFTDAANTAGYLLQQNSLVYHTTAYETFEVFSQHLIEGLKLLHEFVALSYIERIGLRYIDAVVPRKSEKLSQYLSPHVIGLSEVVDGALNHSFTETASMSANGQLVARVLITDGDLAVPPDLFPIRMKLEDRFAKVKGPHAILDTDHFAAERFDFDLDRVSAVLKASHTRIDRAFAAIATDHARRIWKGDTT